MANKTISDLLEKTTVADSDVIWVQNASTDNKVTKANLLKEVNNNLNLKANTTHTHTKSQITDLSLATVATTGSYADLTNKPTIPVVTNDLTNTLKSNYDAAYTHSTSSHAPTTAQKNSDITKAEIESKLTGEITSHTHPNMGGSGSDSVIPLFKETTSANENEIYIAQSSVAEFTVDSNKVTVAGDGTMTIADENVIKSATFTITKNGIFILDVSASTTGFYYIATKINGISVNGAWVKVANKYEYTVNAGDTITINFDNASRNYTFKGYGENKNNLMWKANNEIVNLSMGEQNVQADWNATDSLSDSFIKNKPYVTDNLTSTSATNVLSARQGKILDDKITQNTSSLETIQNDLDSGSFGVSVSFGTSEPASKKTIWIDSKIPDANEWTSFLDLDGKHINCHGAGVMYHNGRYWMYGESKTGKTQNPGHTAFIPTTGVNCYSSIDLVNWKNEGKVLKPNETDSTSPIHTSKVIERPKVIYNEKNNNFVMIFHSDTSDYQFAEVGFAVCDTPNGDFKFLYTKRPSPGTTARDISIFKDDDSKAYIFVSMDANRTMYCHLMNDDYTDFTDTNYPIILEQLREAPAPFKFNDKYFVLTSGQSGWNPNPSKIHSSDVLFAKWKDEGLCCRNDHNNISYGGQSTNVIKVQHGNYKGKFIAMFDKWNPNDLESSTYMWLPLHLDKATNKFYVDIEKTKMSEVENYE